MRFKGWKQIFSFNYLQQVKSKSFIVSTVIICVLIVAIAVLIGVMMFSGLDDIFEDSGDAVKVAERAYIYNETEIPLFDFEKAEIEFVEIGSEGEFEAKQEEVKNGDRAEVVLNVVYEGENEISVKVYRPKDDGVISGDYIGYLANECRGLLKESLLMSLGVVEDDLEAAQTSVTSEVLVYGEEMSEFKEIMYMVGPMIFACIMFIFIVSYAQIIAQSIAMEKTSRVIELLITSVRPLAIVAGKVLAMLLVALTQIVIIGAVGGGCAGVISLIAVGMVGSNGLAEVGAQAAEAIGESAQDIGGAVLAELREAMPGLFDPMSIVFIVIIFLLGFFFYALLAALFGASISRSEDLAAGMQPLALISVAGFMLSYLPSAFNVGYSAGSGEITTDSNILSVIARYLPISSPFALPSAIILGQISVAEIVIGTVILAALTFGTMLLVAKVYENIILYSGNLLKFGQIIKMVGKNGK